MDKRKRILFTEDEDKILRENYPTHSKVQLHKLLPDRSVTAIGQRIARLGLRKRTNGSETHDLYHMPPESEEILFLMGEDEKQCSTCLKIKPHSEFHRNRATPDGYTSSCRACANARVRGRAGRPVSYKREELGIILEGQKQCAHCNEIKPIEDFYPRKTTHDQRFTICKVCTIWKQTEGRHAYEKYGLTAHDYHRMVREQNNLCASCGKPETGLDKHGNPKHLVIDHCHHTGAIRGLLCQRCNIALGVLAEDPDRVRALLSYIEERCLW